MPLKETGLQQIFQESPLANNEMEEINVKNTVKT